ENHLSAGTIAGGSGRISKAEAVAAASQATAPAASAPAATVRAGAAAAAPPVRAPAPAARPATGARTEQRVPMSRLRARIAERLLQAQASAALLTTFNEVDVSAVQGLRSHHKESFEKQHGVKLGLMS